MLKAVKRNLDQFIESQSMGGVVLALAAALALVISNSPWSGAYTAFRDWPGELRVGGDWLVLSKSLLHWVNDLWMAVFFFLVGLEIKRELLKGELASVRQALLPAGAALGGMLMPALIYTAINAGDAVALRGWAIPAATDIAFALGILVLLGSRVPASLKVFLTAVAIMDDLGAILIIAFFYTDSLSLSALAGAGAGAAVLLLLNRLRVMAIGPYVLVGLVIWVFVYKSGIHATLAGVITALAIPLDDGKGGSPLSRAEHALHPWVAFVVLPMFAFANAGVSLQGVTPGTLLESVPLGIAAGLVLGKAVGVFGASWLLIRFAGARLPAGAGWHPFFGVCVLCGVGFTMSLFIGGLAFQGQGADYETQLKIGVLGGSLLAGVLGSLMLLRGSRTPAAR
ncbi:MAG: Na+/H+ antiporter NhaA [Polaromonas sp. 39-63-203]|jgi:NhaA family Na+:H+ antiporter|uniref:Na+/H+ antiporter NhaA n=1 Tax=Polaromonas sp. TaxID=1869339 RepID=UPI000BDA9BCE|nr:Na+/H+ antiporter NhaA [Polaromonas sp.]OYY53794.1 MAG: Na+/H+ antiporter NhaA [Polaromonas sp. 35-63-240]OYZ03155.1 MAG: Na+/H+ antiporter NhaA [Polaromonas sp. 28-63-22]OYZ84768.1 MAG: Na+/H+ antiporter NhaA [Polaromonas sp. 24-62-144]OZB00006.1 MAG: Na+/H+ antiporter NhaA [Polaromonas sp. 39-63-203]HQS33157.1 Na+/H+ antiporter NhaA [Polaromonas sp.]